MATNADAMASEVEGFYAEATRRGVYTKSQENLGANWKTLATSILPSVGVDVKTTTVGQLKATLSVLLKQYGAKSQVKASTISTYDAKASRLITDFLKHHGGSDAAWFQWKSENEKRSAQAAAAAHSRFNTKKPAAPAASAPVDPPPDSSRARHTLKLPASRSAELHVPSVLKQADIKALEAGFAALIGYLRSQIDAESMPYDDDDDDVKRK